METSQRAAPYLAREDIFGSALFPSAARCACEVVRTESPVCLYIFSTAARLEHVSSMDGPGHPKLSRMDTFGPGKEKDFNFYNRVYDSP
jgi:hypothetical protein